MRIKLLLAVMIIFSAALCFGQQAQLNNKLSYTIDSLFKTEPIRSAYDLKSTEKESRRNAKKNLPVVKAILDQYGFPGYDLAGETSSNNYAILVMRSVIDIEFQKRALSLLEMQVKNKNANVWRYASLVDLINIETGKKQVYGTQTTLTDEGFVVKPLIDPANVDARRKAIGINTSLASSLKTANGFYQSYKKGPWVNKITIKDTTRH
ncbi:DUF6624 domain-containing protein [Mucilaginibacter sp. AW1-3]